MLEISNLKKSPELYNQVIDLIHQCFGYDSQNSFEVDFYPLVNKEHHEQNIILLKNNELIGHIGFRIRTINVKNSKVNMALIGGISISPSHQGQGHFKFLMQKTLDQIFESHKVAAYLLWSDQKNLYERYGFYLCGEQFSFGDKKLSPEPKFKKTKLAQLELKHKKQIHHLFQTSYSDNFITFDRKKTWSILEKIDSADLYIKTDNEGNIMTYFFQNKGQDLKEIIYEVGSSLDLKQEIHEISQFGEVWMPSIKHFSSMATSYQFQLFFKSGEKREFKKFINIISSNKVQIEDISSEHIRFKFEQNFQSLSHQDFLQGILGPNRFDEFSKYPIFYVTGLDSL